MKTPINWLNDFTPLTGIQVKTIADKITLTGSKVESIEVTGSEISKVITGRITDITKHPDADKLVICTIDAGDRELQIVTGAKNVSAGDIVPVALDGATLANGLKIKTGKLRGVVSEGMLCSIEELGYTSDDFPDASKDGIYILPPQTPVQQDILSVLGLGESIIDFEITSNRPDCFSIEGLAREIAITMDLPFVPLFSTVKGNSDFSMKSLLDVKISDTDLCQRYIARAIRNIKIGPSPKWMVSRLRDAGIRSINNIVDITNYVMIELGQPMHGFDYSDIHGKAINIRRAKDNEAMKTLDSVPHTLDSSMLVIADAEKPIAMAGIMGGENSEIKDQTKMIILESATFYGINIRLTAKKLGVRTESSSRFEKGLDPVNAKRAMDRACELIEQLDCGEVSSDEIDIYPVKTGVTRIEFRYDKINDFLGTSISRDEMINILRKIECVIVIDKDKTLKEDTYFIEVPTFRPDLVHEVDIAEEIARFYGYNNIEPTLLSGKSTTLGGLNKYQKQKEKLSQIMRSNGFYEACTYSFTSPKIFDKLCISDDDSLRNVVTIANPLGEDFSIMRTTLLGSLLDIASLNWNRGVDDIKIYEIAKVYLPDIDGENELPSEKDTLGAVYFAEKDRYETAESFYGLKGVVEEIIRQAGVEKPKYVPCSGNPSFHPFRTMQILDGESEIGIFGYIHPDVAENMSAPAETVVFMLDLGSLLPDDEKIKCFKPLPKFPSMTRDLSLIIDKNVTVAVMKSTIKKYGGRYLESVEFFDVYSGKQIAEDKKSVSFKLVYRSSEGTLTDDILVKDQNRLLEKLKSELNANLR
ncbi:MAG: phenylalanine--tRNA ligase subunit beta [Saccharofermentanales bacterium]